MRKIDYAQVTECKECYKELSRIVLKSGLSQVKSHYCDADGVCEVCHYKIPPCSHEDTTVVYWPISGECSFTRIDGKKHYVNGWVEVSEWCSCGETIRDDERMQVQNLVLPCGHTKKGKCPDCGAKNGTCKHPDKGYYVSEDGVEYRKNVNKSDYHILHREDFTEYCNNCGYEKHFKSKDFKEPHRYLPGSNVCAICGYDGYTKLTSIKLDKAKASVKRYSSLKLKPTLAPKNASNKALNWISSDETIATVKDGVVNALQCGKVTITCVAQDGGGAIANCTVTVTAIPPKSIEINKPEKTTLLVGETLQLNYTLSPAKAESKVTWRASPNTVAVIDKNSGLLRARGVGIAYVTATAPNAKDKSKRDSKALKITVTDPYLPAGVKLDRTGEVNLNLGETLTLHASLEPETAQSEIDWLTSRKEIATVKGGVVTPRGEGTTKITARTKKKGPGGNYLSASVKVTVVDPTRPSKISIDQIGPLELYMGERQYLSYTLEPASAVSDVTWKSLNPKIAAVTSDGVVKPVKKGTATIQATSKRVSQKGEKVSATVKVKVIQKSIPVRAYLSNDALPSGLKHEASELAVGGVAISNYEMAELVVKISDARTGAAVKSFRAEPWAREYDISAANASLDFASLKSGAYTISVEVTANGETFPLSRSDFSYDRGVVAELGAAKVQALKDYAADAGNRDVFTASYAEKIVKDMHWSEKGIMHMNNLIKNGTLFKTLENVFIYGGKQKYLIELYEKEIISLIDSGTYNQYDYLKNLEEEKGTILKGLRQGEKMADVLTDKRFEKIAKKMDGALKVAEKAFKLGKNAEEAYETFASVYAHIRSGWMVLDEIGKSAQAAQKAEFAAALKIVENEYSSTVSAGVNAILKPIYDLANDLTEDAFDKCVNELVESLDAKGYGLTKGLEKFALKLLMSKLGLDDVASTYETFFVQLDMLYVTADAYHSAFDAVHGGDASDAALQRLYNTGCVAKSAWIRLCDTMGKMEIYMYTVANEALTYMTKPRFRDMPFDELDA